MATAGSPALFESTPVPKAQSRGGFAYPAGLCLLPLLLCATAAAGQELGVTPSWATDGWVSRGEAIELRLSRPRVAGDGRLAVLVDATDLTSLIVWHGDSLVYGPGAVPLRPGEHEVSVWRVGEDGSWSQLERFPLKVRSRAGFERAEVTPATDLTGKGQVGEGHEPPADAPGPVTFQDLTLQAALRTTHTRGDLALRTSFNVVGTTRQEEALRFAEKDGNAPQIDLSSFLLELEKGPVKLVFGHLAFGANRMLANDFSARGVSAALRLSRAVTFEAAVTSGSAIVGWSNISGLAEGDHQIRWATLAAELFPLYPGTLRLELSYLDGSLQPRSSFNQGAVTSAGLSDGGALRLLASDHARRVQLDAGFARSTFRPGEDPQLEAGLAVTPIEAATRSARYGDLTISLLRGARLTGNAQANVTFALHHQRVDPLYGSVAAPLAADLESDGVDLTANLGAAAVQASCQQTEDNLAEIGTLLTTTTRRTAVNAAAPLRDLLGGSAWWPSLTVGADRTHQLASAPRVGSAFDPSQVPDQVSLNLVAGVDWTGERLRGGYHWSSTSQDNRQPFSPAADNATRTDAADLTVVVSAPLELGVDGGMEAQEDRGTGRTDRTRRFGIHGTWQLAGWLTITGDTAKTYSSDNRGQGEQESLGGDAQVAVLVPAGWVGLRSGRAGVFARYSNQRQHRLDHALQLDQDQKAWSVNLGLNLSLY